MKGETQRVHGVRPKQGKLAGPPTKPWAESTSGGNANDAHGGSEDGNGEGVFDVDGGSEAD